MTILKQDNFDSDTVGSIAPGFVNVASATWQVLTTNPVSGANAFGATTQADGNTTVDTSVTALADSILQFDQKIVALAAAGGSTFAMPSIAAVLRADGSGFTSCYAALITSVTGNTAQVTFFKRTGGAFSPLGSAVTATFATAPTVGAILHTKFSAIGSSSTVLSLYLSVGSDALPSTPSATYTDSSSPIAAAGYPGLYYGLSGLSSAPQMTVDNYAFSNTAASLSVSGTDTGGTVGTAYSTPFVASGGTAPYTYSVGSGALPAGMSLNTSTGVVSGTPTTAGIATYVIHAVDSTSGTPLTANSASQSPTIVAPSSNTVAATSAAILYSPGNWAAAGSTMKTINAGAYFETRFSGASCVLAFDMTNVSTPVPNLKIVVDGQAAQYVPLAATVTVTVPAALAASPKHHLRVVVRSTTETQNRWNAPQNTAIVFQSLTLAASAALDLPVRRFFKGLIFGDSITEGVRTLNATAANDTDRNDSTVSWALLQREQLGAEVGVIGFGASGITVGGSGNVPALPSSYNFLWAGQARTFDSDLNFVVLNEGTNDGSTSTTSGYTTVLNGLLAVIPSGCKIFCMRPFNGTLQQANIQAAIAACSAPSRCTFVDTNGWIVNANDTSDNLHPLAPADLASVAGRLGNVILPALTGSTSTGTYPTAAQVLTGITFGPTNNLVGTLTSGATQPTTTRTIAQVVTNLFGIPLANTTFHAAFFDQVTPQTLLAPVDQIASITTSGTGVLTWTPHSALSAGGTGTLILSTTDGTTTQQPAAIAFNGPVTVQ